MVVQSGPGGSRMEQIQRSSITSSSSVGFLSTNLIKTGGTAADAFVGETSLGTMLSSFGCLATPSSDAPLPSRVLRGTEPT